MFIVACLRLFTTVVDSTGQNNCDNLPSHPANSSMLKMTCMLNFCLNQSIGPGMPPGMPNPIVSLKRLLGITGIGLKVWNLHRPDIVPVTTEDKKPQTSMNYKSSYCHATCMIKLLMLKHDSMFFLVAISLPRTMTWYVRACVY